MRKIVALAALIACVLSHAAAQFTDQGLGAGVGFGGTLGQTDLQDKKAEFFGRAFLRYGIVNHVQVEVGAGLGRVSGAEFRTFIIPVDLRLLLSPLSSETWNPYLYAGIGSLFYKQEEFPATVKQRAQSSSTSVIPLGAGLQYLFSDRTALEVSGGYNMTGSDSLNAVALDATNDAYWSFSLGLTVLGESGSADPDHDGLTNSEEKELKTDPRNADTDGDGLTDGEEVNRYKTNPLKADSDGDGLKDKDEALTLMTDPNKKDTDDDALTDGEESVKYKTDPLKADTDGDGLSDGDEITKYKTNPLKADSDGDGLSDSDEITKYMTNPERTDTDSGSVDDGKEIENKTNPLDPKDDIKKEEIKIEIGAAIVLDGIVFESGKSEIKPESQDILEKAYNTLYQNPDITVEIRGYTDNTGGRATNVRLSQARADAVKDYLVKKGVVAERMATKGFGSADPIAPNATKEGKQKNRRIEFFRVK